MGVLQVVIRSGHKTNEILLGEFRRSLAISTPAFVLIVGDDGVRRSGVDGPVTMVSVVAVVPGGAGKAAAAREATSAFVTLR